MPALTRQWKSTGAAARYWILVAAVLVAAGCEPAAQPGPPPPPEVTARLVQPEDIEVTYEYVGQTAGYREVEVRARVTGILTRENYHEGARVRQGQSLFTIDPALYQAALKRAEADLATAEAKLAQARRDMERLKPVLEANAVSRKEYDDSLSAEQIAAAEAKGARARLDEARLNLEYTRVESPITGVASRALRSVGSLVSGPEILLTTVTQTDPMYAIFGIPDRERLEIQQDVEAGRLVLPKNGQFRVEVRRSDGTVYAKTGLLNFTDVRVNPQTGTSEARAVLPNPDGALRPGEFVRVILRGAHRPDAMRVPQRAVLEGPQGKFVYVAVEGKAEARPVRVGPWSGDEWIITSGLNAGERVIVDGVLKVRPGAPVRVVEEGQKEGAPPEAAPSRPTGG